MAQEEMKCHAILTAGGTDDAEKDKESVASDNLIVFCCCTHL